MSSLLKMVTLFSFACLLFPQSVLAEGRFSQSANLARSQLAFKQPSMPVEKLDVAGTQQTNYQPVSQMTYQYPAIDSLGFDRNSLPVYSNGVSDTRDVWSAAESGVSSAYTNTSSALERVAPPLGYARNPARILDNLVMTRGDIEAARQAIRSGSFFRWHGTQSSHISRNR